MSCDCIKTLFFSEWSLLFCYDSVLVVLIFVFLGMAPEGETRPFFSKFSERTGQKMVCLVPDGGLLAYYRAPSDGKLYSLCQKCLAQDVENCGGEAVVVRSNRMLEIRHSSLTFLNGFLYVGLLFR
jgi:hypothetical protein